MPQFKFVQHRRVDRFLTLEADTPTEAAKKFEEFISVKDHDAIDDYWDEVDDSDEGNWEFCE